METNHSPHSSSMEIPCISDNGDLTLLGDPSPWIENSAPASLLLVKHLQLNFNGECSDDEDHEIGDSINRLTRLTHLTVENAKSFNCLPDSMVNLHSLQFLKFINCTDLPVNLGVLKMNLTHFTLYNCDEFKLLPKSLATLSNLTSLHVENCKSLMNLPANFGKLSRLTHLSVKNCSRLQSLPNSMTNLLNLDTLSIKGCSSLVELPANLGELRSLKNFDICSCGSLKYLPNSIANLLNLETLSVENMFSLTELPVNLKVTFLKIINCRIHSIPRGLINLSDLEFSFNVYSKDRFGNLKDLVNLHHLTLDCGSARIEAEIPELTANLKQLVNLHILCFRSQGFIKLPDSLDGLDELILLDIQDTTVKYLPWSITKLCKLKVLMLPSDFRLGTLPSHLNDSVLISVYNKHVRKTWKELKKEIGLSAFPIPQGLYPSIVAPPGYLRLQGGLGHWIRDNYESRTLVKMLDLVSPSCHNVKVTKNSIGKLPYLTHLFLTDSPREVCLPGTLTWLKHLCLKSCLMKSQPDNLGNLSNLETLELINTTCPEKTYLPLSLRHISLQSHSISSFPINISRLYNLHTLELRGCYNLTSLPPMNIVTLKINRIINSLPMSLRHLEILHVERDHCDEYCDGSKLEHCLTQMVNLEMLSLTCDRIKSLPSMAGPRNLRVLLLKDCFSLKELLPGLEQLVELHTLNISGTRIKSLPDSIIKLSKLQQLTLPKCFTQKLPKSLEEVSIVDDTDKRYYDYVGYFDSEYETIADSSYEGNDVVVGSIEGVDEALTVNRVQEVSNGQSYEQDDVIAKVPRGPQDTSRKDLSDGYNHHAGCSSYNQDVEMHYISEKSQQSLQNERLGDTVTEKNEQENAPSDRSNLSFHKETENNQGALENGQLLLSENAKSRTQKLDLLQKKIQPFLLRNMRLVDSAKHLRVLRYRLKRSKIRYGITWPSRKRRKQWHDAKGEPNTDSPCLEKPSIPADHGHEQKFSKGATAAMETVEQPFMETVKKSRTKVPQHVEVHLDCANQSNIALSSGRSSSFDFVKACYEGDPVWIDFSVTSSFDQLMESVCKKFGLEVNKFKIKYLDDDKEWLLMTCISDLTHALLHTSSSGRKFVRLSITDTGILNTERASEGNNGQIIPNKSQSRSTCVSIQFEREESKCVQYAEENQPSNKDHIPFHEFCSPRIKPLIESHINVKSDGNCGFRVLAAFEYGDEEKWLDVRIDLLKELHSYMNLYKKTLGDEEFDRANFMVNWLVTPAKKMHWFEATCLGLVVATKYQKVFTCWSNECCTYLPLVSRFVDQKPPTKYINMGRINGNHFIALQMPTNIPLPPISPLWKSHRCDTVKHWNASIFKKQLDDYLQLHD